jgi:endonuclease/exonuclease/phosphatase family metal-dependent hydrolase
VSIWSRYPLEPLTTSDEQRTAAARIRPASGDPFVVYGTVLPWIGSAWRAHASAEGVAFREALAVQAADWMQIRSDYPGDEFFILGDLNQGMVSPPAYGSIANRTALEKALGAAGLAALTAGDGDPIRRDSGPRAGIDHICARGDSNWRAEPAVRWPDLPVPEKWLSDHFGVSVSFHH